MNEDTLTVSVDTTTAEPILAALRRMRDRPDWCDHCNHGDHHVCIRWGWNADGCRCSHDPNG